MSPWPERIFTEPFVEFTHTPLELLLTAGPVGKSVPEAPPPRYMFPAADDVALASQEPIVLRHTFSQSPMFPLPLAPAQRTTSEPVVWMVVPAFTVMTPVAFRKTLPLTEMKLPLEVIVWHKILISELAEILPEPLFENVPELQDASKLESPLTEAFTATLPPVDASVNEREVAEVTALETVTVPADCNVAFPELN